MIGRSKMNESLPDMTTNRMLAYRHGEEMILQHLIAHNSLSHLR
jgi:hypothetical protein